MAQIAFTTAPNETPGTRNYGLPTRPGKIARQKNRKKFRAEKEEIATLRLEYQTAGTFRKLQIKRTLAKKEADFFNKYGK